MVQINRRSCGNKKLQEYISDQEIKVTIKIGNTGKNFAAEKSLLQEQTRKLKKGFVFRIKISYTWIKYSS